MDHITLIPPTSHLTRSEVRPTGATNWRSSNLETRVSSRIIHSEERLLKSSIRRNVHCYLFTFTAGKTTPFQVTFAASSISSIPFPSFPEFTGRKIDVIGVYIAWRGKDLTFPGLNFLTFWSRKSTGQGSPGRTAAWPRLKSLPWPPVNPAKIIIIPCCSDIPLVHWFLGTRFRTHPRCQWRRRAQQQRLGYGGGI